ncbi:MAG: D-alanyl-D-alanine carboxypeptidase [Oscillospiraceae bacterium]|nr:D-alanyl-D-alanine carboxypeptidase [Oscillospiraceae bacterium]
MENMKKTKFIKTVSLFISCIIFISCININAVIAADLQITSDNSAVLQYPNPPDPADSYYIPTPNDSIAVDNQNSADASADSGELKSQSNTADNQANQDSQGITVSQPDLGIKAGGCILIEADTGTVLYEQNADGIFPPASVTKVMSLLLIMEALDDGRISLDDKVTVSDYASSMGGSQVYLEPGEEMTLNDMLKAIVVASANDATVAVAEHIAGSVDAFVARMNERAKELGMTNTTFKNATGLDADGHVTTARDIAIMSRELLKHKKIFDYTTIWMDTLRDGQFGISNTNKLIRFYPGANGLKTGSTGLAKYCLSASAMRNNMQLIAVIMAAPTSDDRFAGAKKLLDYGFATYAVYKTPQEELAPVRITGGVFETVQPTNDTSSFLIAKGKEKSVQKQVEMAETLAAPIEKGQKIGVINYTLDGKIVKSVDITASESVKRISFWGIFGKMAKKYFMMD